MIESPLEFKRGRIIALSIMAFHEFYPRPSCPNRNFQRSQVPKLGRLRHNEVLRSAKGDPMNLDEVLDTDSLRAIRNQWWPWAVFLSFTSVVGYLTLHSAFAWLGVFSFFLLFLVGGAIGILWWRLGPRRWWIFGGRARINQYRDMYDKALARADSPNFALVRVHKVGATDENGTKAVIRHTNFDKQEAFFWGHTPQVGQVLSVRVQTANGGHLNRALQLHIGFQKSGGGVFDVLPPATWFYGRQKRREPRQKSRPAFLKPRPIHHGELAHHDLRHPTSELRPDTEPPDPYDPK